MGDGICTQTTRPQRSQSSGPAPYPQRGCPSGLQGLYVPLYMHVLPSVAIRGLRPALCVSLLVQLALRQLERADPS
jgi:hypothetical protein